MTVIVVGGGIAGLTAAERLTALGIECVVLEAQARVGGRMRGIELAPGGWADAGAAYLGHLHTALKATIAEHGLRTVPTTMVGDSRFALAGAPIRCPGRFPPLSAVGLGDMFEQLEALVRTVDVTAPWRTPDAARLDTTTVAAWAERLPHPDARLFFPLFLGEMMAADPARISVLHMAFYLRSGGGIRYLNAFEGGAQAERIDGGAYALCAAIAARLGDRVRLETPVHAIAQRGDRVVVETARGAIEGSAAIVALPPALADRLTYTPALPAPRATSATAPGCAVKVHLIFPAPLWREHGLSGWSVSADGPMLSTVDDSPRDGAAGVLTGFITGREATEFAGLGPDEQRARVLAQARRLFPELPAPRSLHITDWISEPYARGCYAALFGPGDWLALGPDLIRPHGRVHWAGTETHLEFFGLMEGAIRSAHRAAREVAALLPRVARAAAPVPS